MASKNCANHVRPSQPFSQKKSDILTVEKIGFLLKKHQWAVSVIQWCMVCFYLFLLLAPFAASLFEPEKPFWKDLHVFSVFLFWGVGWPIIVLFTMLFGRIWCGVFCPDGTLTESVSHYGKQQSIPRWIRWPGWTKVTFAIFTLSMFFTGAIHQHRSTAILLGSFTLFALLTGYLYGRGKRIWCMYLCPSNMIFTYLAKLSPLHFQVDREKWNHYQGTPERINCAPLVNIKQMQSTSFCHACGRCSGYRNAVKTAVRSFDHEILSEDPRQISTVQALALLFGIIAPGMTLFLLSVPAIQQMTASHPFLPFAAALAGSLLTGSLLWGMIWFSWKKSLSDTLTWQQLSYGLIPLAAIGLLTGLMPISFELIAPALWIRHTLLVLQLLLLVLAFFLSVWLGAKLTAFKIRKGSSSMLLYSLAAGIPAVFWLIGFWMQI